MLSNIVNSTTSNPSSPSGSFSYLWIAAVVLIVLILMKLLRKKNPSRTFVYLVGERGSGKTRLFYKLTGGKDLETVPSCKNNVSPLVIDNQVRTVVDVTGDMHSKEEFLANIGRAIKIILLVDGANPQSFAATAELLYRISTSKVFQEREPDLLIALNKSERAEYVGEKMFKKQLEDEIERIKLSRKALIEDREGEEDFLREQKDRYALPYPIAEVTVLGNIKAIDQFLSQ